MARLVYDSTSDYYQVLGIQSTASLGQIRKAYHKLARRHHPDTNPEWEDDVDATRHMVQLNEAYAVLRDPAIRVEYDRVRWQHIQQRTQQAQYYERARYDERAHAQAKTRAQGRTGPQGPARAQQRAHSQTRQQSSERTRTYTQGGTRRSSRPKQDPFTEPPGGWPEITFRRSSLGLLFVGVVLACVFCLSVSTLTVSLSWTGVLIASSSFMAGALMFLAAVPYFQGYIELERDQMVIYSTFGLFPPRTYRYDQICGVHERVLRTKSGVRRHIVIDYYWPDATGRYDVTRFYSKRLIKVDDHHALLHTLRVRARACLFPFSKPTWQAFVIGNWELLAPMEWAPWRCLWCLRFCRQAGRWAVQRFLSCSCCCCVLTRAGSRMNVDKRGWWTHFHNPAENLEAYA